MPTNLNPDARQCTAKSKSTGNRCQNVAVTGYNVCRVHGANPNNRGGAPKGRPKPPGSGGPPPKGHFNGYKHGAYSARLPPEDVPLYEAIKEQFIEELGGNDLTASDTRLIHQLAVVSTKFDTAVEKGAPPDALNVLNKMILDLLRELKATRASKDLGPKGGNTPAEIMATLLMAVAERKALVETTEPKPVAQTERKDLDAEYEVVEVADALEEDPTDSLDAP